MLTNVIEMQFSATAIISMQTRDLYGNLCFFHDRHELCARRRDRQPRTLFRHVFKPVPDRRGRRRESLAAGTACWLSLACRRILRPLSCQFPLRYLDNNKSTVQIMAEPIKPSLTLENLSRYSSNKHNQRELLILNPDVTILIIFEYLGYLKF